MIREIDKPPLSAGPLRAVLIECADIAGQPLVAVTVRTGCGKAPRRRWFADAGLAWAHAAEQADALELPLLAIEGAADE